MGRERDIQSSFTFSVQDVRFMCDGSLPLFPVLNSGVKRNPCSRPLTMSMVVIIEVNLRTGILRADRAGGLPEHSYTDNVCISLHSLHGGICHAYLLLNIKNDEYIKKLVVEIDKYGWRDVLEK